jgi:hypothetical protein
VEIFINIDNIIVNKQYMGLDNQNIYVLNYNLYNHAIMMNMNNMNLILRNMDLDILYNYLRYRKVNNEGIHLNIMDIDQIVVYNELNI